MKWERLQVSYLVVICITVFYINEYLRYAVWLQPCAQKASKWLLACKCRVYLGTSNYSLGILVFLIFPALREFQSILLEPLRRTYRKSSAFQ